MTELTEPLLVALMRGRDGEVCAIPDGKPKSGTSIRGFLYEFDKYVEAERQAAVAAALAPIEATIAAHRLHHDPETGAGFCDCGEWTGPYTRTTDDRSWPRHVTRAALAGGGDPAVRHDRGCAADVAPGARCQCAAGGGDRG